MSVLAKSHEAVVVGRLQEEPESEEARGGREECELREHAGDGDERLGAAGATGCPGSPSVRRRS